MEVSTVVVYAHSMDEMTFLFLSMTKFCTRVFLVSGVREPYPSSNIAERCAGKSAVSLG